MTKKQVLKKITQIVKQAGKDIECLLKENEMTALTEQCPSPTYIINDCATGEDIVGEVALSLSNNEAPVLSIYDKKDIKKAAKKAEESKDKHILTMLKYHKEEYEHCLKTAQERGLKVD